MSRYPFKACVSEFIRATEGSFSHSTLEVSIRRFNRMDKELNYLKSENLISTTNPKTLTVNDVKAYHIFLKAKTTVKGTKITNKSIDHDLNDLNNLCRYYGNRCIEDFHYMCPSARSRTHTGRLPVFSSEEMSIIRNRASLVRSNDFRRIRAYALVSLYVGGGLRTVELQHLKIENIHVFENIPFVYLDYVKGQETYGQERNVVIIPQFVPAIERYISARSSYLNSHSMESDYAFFSLDQSEMLTDKTIRQIRDIVENDTNLDFDGRKCRRSYGQYLKNCGVAIEVISRNMGHSTTKTTETYYARISSEDSVNEAFKIMGTREW